VDELKKIIAENYHRFDVLQLIDVIRENFSNKKVFFETDASLAFPPGDVSSVSINDDPRQTAQTTIRLPLMNFLGVTTPLPIGLTDYANRGRRGSEPLKAFMSIMQNRLHYLMIIALRKYNIWRDAGSPAMRLFEKLSARSLDQFEDYDLFWLSAFARRTRSADGLKRVLQSIWKDVPVRIEENVGRWTVVENRCSLGRGLRLSQGAVAGKKVFDRTAKFRVSLGPVDVNTYKSLLPGSDNARLLKNIISLYINEPLICELEISCRQRDLDPLRVGVSSEESKDSGGVGRTMVLGRSRCEDNKVHRYRTTIT